MTTDFRALCVELTDCLEKADWHHRYKVVFQQWTYIARKALAEPKPEGPTDEELLHVAARAIEPYESCGIAIGEYEPETECAVEVHGSELISFARAVLARRGTPNLAETRRSLKDAWAAHQPAIEAAANAGMDACRVDGPAVPQGREPASVTSQPSDHLYVHFASLEWKLGCHMAQWKAARDELNQAHCDGVVRLLREHLEGHGQA